MEDDTKGDAEYHAKQRKANIEAGLEGAFWMLSGPEIEKRLVAYNEAMRLIEAAFDRTRRNKP